MKVLQLFLISSFWLLFMILSSQVQAAEVLQVRSSNTLQVGDHNRIYTVRLACVEIDPLKEIEALTFLKSEFKKHRRVNLRPLGSNNGILLAGVMPINSDKEIGKKIAEDGLGKFLC